MISAAGLPIFSDSVLTVMTSVVITAFSILIGSGLMIICCFFGRLRFVRSSSHAAFRLGAASFS